MRVTNSRLALNAVLVASVVALVLWLYYDRRPATSRREAIDRALREGTIGGLRDDEAAQLLRTLNWLGAAAEVKGPILLNQPFRQSSQAALHVFTTTSGSQNLTHCGADNAVYDAELDAIFIDLSIVKPTQWNEALQAPTEGPGLDIKMTLDDLPFLRVYMRFVLLHELGHRKLHGRGGGFFDVGAQRADPAQRRREDEADQFAISRMVSAYGAAAEHQIKPVEPNTGNLIGYPVEEGMTPQEQVLISLVEMAQSMTVGKLALSSAVSPFSESATHRSYLDRSQGLVKQALTVPIDNPRLKAYVKYADAYLERVREVSRSDLIELTSTQPLRDVDFDERGLLIFTEESRALRRVSYKVMTSLLEGRRFSSVEENSEGLEVPDGVDDLYGLWSAPGVGMISLRSDGSANVIDQSWRRAKPLTFSRAPGGAEFGDLILPPQPSLNAVAVSGENGNEWFHSFTGAQMVAAVSAPELQKNCAVAGAPAGASLDLARARLSPPNLFVPLIVESERGGSAWYGFAVLDAPSLRVAHVRALRLPPDQSAYHADNPLLDPESGSNQLVALTDGGSERFILLDAIRRPSERAGMAGRGIKWEAWEVSVDADPRPLASHQFLSAAFDGALRLDDAETLALSPKLSARGVSLSPPHNLLVTWENDSTYLLDLENNVISVAFHPDVEALNLKTASDGTVAICARGGRKLFVFRPGTHAGSSPSRGWMIGVASVLIVIFMIMLGKRVKSPSFRRLFTF